jgi:hypothetical protein
MPTDKQRYTAKLNELAARYGRLEDGAANDILRMLQQTRREVLAQIADASTTEASQFRLQQLQQNIDRLIAEFEAAASARLNTAIAQAVDIGGVSVTDPLQTLGFTQVFYSPSKAQVNVLQGFTTDLITGLTAEVRRTVDRQVRFAALGQISPFDAMRAVTDAFGREDVKQGRKIVSGVSAKAEMDIRTEMQRALNLSSHSAQMQTAEMIPGLLKRWIATGDGRTRRGHLEIHLKTKDNPIPVNEPFKVRDWRYSKKRGWRIAGTADLQFPCDPSAPAAFTVNCRCRVATIHPQIGTIGSSLDGRVSQMLSRAQNP